MNGLLQFILDHTVLLGGLAFGTLLFNAGTRTERVFLLVIGISLAILLMSGSVEVTLGILIIGGALLLVDRLRAAT
jgi:hypothetical protein